MEILYDHSYPTRTDLACEFCGRYQGTPNEVPYGTSYVVVWKDHFEQHLDPPRKITVCDGCHSRLHRNHREELRNKKKSSRTKQ